MTTTQAKAPTKDIYAYDLVPYESLPFPHSSPIRLATIAALFGLQTKPLKKCRVLELGSASGGNLIPHAINYPESEFVGIDLSEKQIEEGQNQIKKLGLKNVTLKHLDIKKIDDKLGKFDYILAHGVFSWIQGDVQEKLLEVCKKNLSDDGVAYVSYNTFPGWHFHGMIRDMMLYHTAQFNDPSQKAVQARALLDFLSQSVPTENNAYGLLLKNAVDLMRQVKDYYLLHDHLEQTNEPVYFYQFIERANKQGLQYLAESEFSTMLTSNFPKEVSETIQRISNDIVRTEQYMDFVRNRTFRQTLLCHQDATLNRNISPDRVTNMYILSAVQPTPETNLETLEPGAFTLPNGSTLSTTSPLSKAAFGILGSIFPQSIHFDELLTQARSRLSSLSVRDAQTERREREVLATDMLTAYTANAVNLHAFKPPVVTVVAEKPKANEFTRLQAETPTFDRVTNQFHESIFLDSFNRNLIALLDGTRHLDEITQEMVKRARAGQLVVQKDGKNIENENELKEILAPLTEQGLKAISRAGLLVE